MNVPDDVWEKVSKLLDLGISLIPVIGIIGLVIIIASIVIFVKVTKFIMRHFDQKEKEFDRKHQKHKEQMELFKGKHFPNDD